MSKGQLKTGIGWALCAAVALLIAAPGCAVETSEPYPEDIGQEDPAVVVTGHSLDPGSMGTPEETVDSSEDGPTGKHESPGSSATLASEEDDEGGEDEEPDPDPWQIPSLPGGSGGDDDGSSGVHDPN